MKAALTVCVLSALGTLCVNSVQAHLSDIVGPIHGRQIVVTTLPGIAGEGVNIPDKPVLAVLPTWDDLDRDTVLNWHYRWELDGKTVMSPPPGSVAASDNIPFYTVMPSGSEHSLVLCLKAEANRGYPDDTRWSNEQCSLPITLPAQTVSIVPPGSLSVLENTPLVTHLIANASYTNALEWKIKGGVDADKFTLDRTSGELTFVAQDAEAPTDQDGDNRYDVLVQVTTSGSSVTNPVVDELPLIVTVQNVLEEINPSVRIVTDGKIANGSAANIAELSLTDEGGRAIVGREVQIDAGRATVTPANTLTDDNGVVSVQVTHDVAELVTVTFSWIDMDGTINKLVN